LATFPERGLASINSALVFVTDAILGPFAGTPPLVSLVLLSLATAAVIVPVMARTSDQARLRQTKRRIQAALLEVRLYNDDPRAVFRSVGDALRANLTYLRLSIVPLAVLGLPIVLLVAHLDPFYGYDGLTPGVPALLEVERRDSARPDAAISLETPAAIVVETGAVQLAAEGEVLWRITPTAPGEFVVALRVGRDVVHKTVRAAAGLARRSPARVQPGIWRQLLHPSEPPLDRGGPFSAVTVTYAEAGTEILGTRVHWTIVYFALTIAWTLALARVWHVTL
jgi:hypothetical protein